MRIRRLISTAFCVICLCVACLFILSCSQGEQCENAEHSLSVYRANGSFHWQECTDCGKKISYEAHEGYADGACNVCKKTIEATSGVIYEVDGTSSSARVVDYVGKDRTVFIKNYYKGYKVTSIEPTAFAGKNIVNVVMNKFIRRIEDNTFLNCKSLAKFELGEGVTFVSPNAFIGCDRLNVIESDGGEYLSTVDNPYYMLLSVKDKDVSEFTINPKTVVIAQNAMYRCNNITSLTVPNSVKYILEFAFAECTAIDDLVVGSSVVAISDFAFNFIYGVERMSAPGNVFDKINKFELKEATITGYADVPNGCFNNCTTLETVTVSDSIKKIGSRAFYGCLNLKSLDLGNGLESIGTDAFSYCYELKSVRLPNSVQSLSDGVFYRCEGLEQIKLSNNVKGIASRTFSGCVSLKSVKIPNSVSFIGTEAFLECTNLESIILGEGVLDIYKRAFKDCESLKEVTLSANLRLIEGESFENCKSLQIINAYSLQKWCDIYGLENIVLTNAKVLFDGKELSGKITLTKPILTIKDYAFYNFDNITEVEISDFIIDLGSYVFAGCDGLKSVKIGNGIKEIDGTVFAGCDNLVNVELNDNLDLFSTSFNTENLNCNLYKNVKYLGSQNNPYMAIVGVVDSQQETYEINDQAKFICQGAFENCTNLTDFEISREILSIDSKAFKNCSSLREIKIYHNVKSIGAEAFYGCKSVSEIVIEGDATIGKNAFAEIYDVIYVEASAKLLYNIHRDNIQRVIINGGESITSSLFENSESLKEVYIGDTIKDIGKKAFYGCKNLEVLEMGSGVEIISSGAIAYCEKLTSITIPASVKVIEAYFGFGCSNLQSVCFKNPEGWHMNGVKISSADLLDSRKVINLFNLNLGRVWIRFDE